MTIAACYVSAEGVVFGADSTTTMFVDVPGSGQTGQEHHYNHAQKVFEIGRDSTLAIAMWGLGSLGNTSYRTMIAQFADSLSTQDAQSLSEVANQWSQFFWSSYSSAFAELLQRTHELQAKTARTPQEENELRWLAQTFSGGFCVGGYLPNDRVPGAYEMLYAPTMTRPPSPNPLSIASPRFWGCPNLIERLMYGLDSALYTAILQSDKWNGTSQELFDLAAEHFLSQPRHLPIREAIDWVHASIYTTIKMMKFSHMPPVCGGPVELAVVTTDRPFRWVHHKRFDAAVAEGGLYDV